MKIFNKVEPVWGNKVNFVDEKNVVLGYDLTQDCCEDANWFIADSSMSDVPDDLKTVITEKNFEAIDFAGWLFDVAYFKEFSNTPSTDKGGMVVFRITKDGSEKFIHLHNSHNGYYGHGFDFLNGSEKIKEGTL